VKEATTETLRQCVDAVFSKEQTDEWLNFRECFNDETIRKIPEKEFILHMRALYLQLVGAVLAKTQGANAARLASGSLPGLELFIHLRSCTRQQPEFSQELDQAYSAYNKAFGSSSTNGVGEMVKEYSRRVCGGALSSEASVAMMDLLQGAWENLRKKFAVPRTLSAEPMGSAGGNGCLIPILLVVTLGVTAGFCLV